jgi:hypothetical protein
MPAMAQAPGIHQAVAGPVSNPRTSPGHRQQRQVGDAAEVEHGAIFDRIGERIGVERRHQRRALAAGGDVAAAEIGDGVDAGGFRDHVGVAQLQREGRGAQRPVPQRLPVRADRAHLPASTPASFSSACAASAKAWPGGVSSSPSSSRSTRASACDTRSTSSRRVSGKG